jgi:hypothetical protein
MNLHVLSSLSVSNVWCLDISEKKSAVSYGGMTCRCCEVFPNLLLIVCEVALWYIVLF